MNSILNFRDFSPLKTRENAAIRANKLFRSAAPEYGTKDDFSRLHALNLDTIIDFREEDEKRPELTQTFNAQFPRQAAAINVANLFDHNTFDLNHLTEENIDFYYQCIYEKLPTHFHHQYRTLIDCANRGETMLFHCSAGKDRTGFGAYLLLSALDVHIDDIMEDYLRSNDSAIALYEARKHEHEKMAGTQIPKATIERLFGVKAAYLDTALHTIQATHKTSDRYLTEALSANIDAIRAHYLL